MLNAAAMVLAGTAAKNAITHMQLHSTNVGGAWGSGALGSRVAVSGYAAVGGTGTITWTGVPFTGLGASAAVGGVSYWSASSGGTNYGGSATSGDATANAAGEYTLTTVTETASAS
jgi:hypothetical protein